MGARGLYDPADGARLPSGFRALEVVECALEQRPYAGEGSWSVVVERRATTGLDALVSALQAPSEPPRAVSCDLQGHQIVWMALRGADGTWIHPAVPSTFCGQPQAAFLDAESALTFREAGITRVAPLPVA